MRNNHTRSHLKMQQEVSADISTRQCLSTFSFIIFNEGRWWKEPSAYRSISTHLFKASAARSGTVKWSPRILYVCTESFTILVLYTCKRPDVTTDNTGSANMEPEHINCPCFEMKTLLIDKAAVYLCCLTHLLDWTYDDLETLSPRAFWNTHCLSPF